jgi:hypothetical protein
VGSIDSDHDIQCRPAAFKLIYRQTRSQFDLGSLCGEDVLFEEVVMLWLFKKATI